MFDENSPIVETNPPTEDTANVTLAPITSESVTLPETKTDELPVLEAVVPTPARSDDSAQARISELNKEAMNRRLEAKRLKDELDQKTKEAEQLAKLLADRNQELENGRAANRSELTRLTSEKDAEILRAKAEADALRVETLKVKFGIKFRLPESLWGRLSGNTAEEIEQDARQLKSTLPQPNLSNDSEIGINQPSVTPSVKELTDQKRREYRM